MAQYIENNIQFTNVIKPSFTTSGRIAKGKYILDDQDNILNTAGYVINAIDIDWNGAYLESLDTYINSTGDLLYQIQRIYSEFENGIENIDLSEYLKSEDLTSELLVEKLEDIFAPKSLENEIPTSVYQLNGIDAFATTVWVNNQLRNYSKSAYDVYVDNGGTLSQTDWLASLHGRDGVDGLSAYELAKQSNPYIGSESEWLASLQGTNGLSAYQIAYNNDPTIGTQEEWIASLKGQKGDKGDNGKSAYQLAKENGFEGTEEEWITSLKGEKGERGDKGDPGPSINILGYYETLEQLKEATADTINSIGDAYNVGGVFYTYNDKYTSIDDKWNFAGSIQGNDGKSAYELAVLHGFEGTEGEWVASLKGQKGDKGDQGESGEKGDQGEKGRSAFDIAQQQGFEGTEEEWIASLKGQKGDKGDQGEPGEKGDNGLSAYEIAKQINPNIGTVTEWLNSYKGEKGDKGDDGKSAYEIYYDIQTSLGHTPLSQEDWINSIGNGVQYSAGYGIDISNGQISIKKNDIWEVINE